MTPFPDCPTPEQAKRAAAMLEAAASYLEESADSDYHDQAREHWKTAISRLQDALAELGFDLRPLRKPAPATAEALFDDAAYARGRGM